MSGLSALRRSGRFMVMVSRPESSFCRTMSFIGFAFVLLLIVVVPANAGTHHPGRQLLPMPSAAARNDRPRRMGPRVRGDDGLGYSAFQMRPDEPRPYFFTSGQRDSSSDWNASLPGMVASSL